MIFADLLREYDGPERIGEQIWSLLVEVTGNVCRRYPPSIYADDSVWTPEAIEDLALSVALERLLGEGQLDYMFTIAASDRASGVNTIKGLMGHQVQRTLAHRRAPSVVDRLIARIRSLLDEGVLRVVGDQIGRELWLHGTGTGRLPSELTPAERSRGGHAIADVPRIPSNPNGQRESKVYAKPQLRIVIERLVQKFDGIYLSDVRRILEELLTGWLPEILYDPEGLEAVAADLLDDLEMRQLSEQAAAAVARLTEEQVTVLVGKSNGVADAVLARELGCSRPTVIKHKRGFEAVVEAELLSSVLPDRYHIAMELLVEHALIRTGGDRDGRS